MTAAMAASMTAGSCNYKMTAAMTVVITGSLSPTLQKVALYYM